MRILLTGTSGFVGKALLPALAAEGHQITALSRHPSNLPGLAAEISAETSKWPEAVSGKTFDLCIHLAWIAIPGVYLNSPENDTLAEMTIRLADTLFASGLPHFLAFGTCIEYSPAQDGPCIPGKTPTEPETIYGKAKNLARKGVEKAAVASGKGHTWVRLFYPYGIGEHESRIPSTFLRNLGSGKPLDLKTPNSTKDWIEINDIVRAILAIIRNGKPLGAINLGTGSGTSIRDLALAAAATVGAAPDLVRAASPLGIDPYPFHVADVSELRSIGWKPVTTLASGLKALSQNLQIRKP